MNDEYHAVNDPDDRLFCETAPPRHLLKSERFAKHEDDEADAHFLHFDILRKQKVLIDKAHGGGRLKQAYIEYIASQR